MPRPLPPFPLCIPPSHRPAGRVLSEGVEGKVGMGLEARGCRWGHHDGSQGLAGLRLSSCLLEAQFSWGSLNMEALVRGSGVGAGEPRVCVSHSVPGDVDTAGEGATVWRRGAHTEGRWGAELLPTPNCPTPLMPRRPRCGTGVKACMSRAPPAPKKAPSGFPPSFAEVVLLFHRGPHFRWSLDRGGDGTAGCPGPTHSTCRLGLAGTRGGRRL